MKRKAFSIIEILVALIVVSVITAALAPVITKRLKASSVSVLGGNGGGGGSVGTISNEEICKVLNMDWNGTQCVEREEEEVDNSPESCKETNGAPSKECCEEMGAIYISSDNTDGLYQGEPICMTAYNPGDDKRQKFKSTLHYASLGVSMRKTGETCFSAGNCCWTGGATCLDCDSAYGDYSGCERTVCQYNAAKTICENWAPNGSKIGSWRLPTNLELEQIINVIKKETKDKNYINLYQGIDGLQLCGVSVDGISRCNDSSGSGGYCIGATSLGGDGDTCALNNLWSYEVSSLHFGCALAMGYVSDYGCSGSGNNVKMTVGNTKYAFSFRCVSTNISKEDSTYVAPEIYVPQNSNEPKDQSDCDKLAQNLMFIPAKYNGTNGKNLCVTKFNAGDPKGPNIDYAKSQIAMLNPGVACPMGKYCCWIGDGTSLDVGTIYGDYAGNNRCLCQFYAAQNLCANWSPDGKTQGKWRLPTSSEVTGWAYYINIDTQYSAILNNYLGNNGLQLCAVEATYGATQCNDGGETACNGATVFADGGNCTAPSIWTSEANSMNLGCASRAAVGYINDYNCEGSTQNVKTPASPHAAALSTRCVYDGQRYSQDTSYVPSENEPKSQADCNKISEDLLFIPAVANGFNGKNLCVTKFNAGDYSGPQIPENHFINVGAAINTENTNTYTCIQGVTSGSFVDLYSGYSAQQRTLCAGYTNSAINEICANYKPKGTINWRLPTENEVIGWQNYLNFESTLSSFITKYLNYSGLRLCDSTNGYGSSVCSAKSSCYKVGTANKYCYPYAIWTQGGAYYYSLVKGKITLTSATYTNNNMAFSVRCVTDDISGYTEE